MHNMRALVVDDSKVGRLTMQKKLESFGIGVDLAESGVEALSYLERHRPDVIFMDHMMPELDGFEATRRIKATPATRDIPVIIISGSDDETFVRDARAVGAHDAIAKPPATEAIERVLGSLPRAPTPSPEATTAAPPRPHETPAQPTALPDQAVVQAMVEDRLGQALERLREGLRETLRRDWAAAIEGEREARHRWSEQIGQRLDALAATQTDTARLMTEAQDMGRQLSGLGARLAALQEVVSQITAPPETWFEGAEARFAPRLQEIDAQIERHRALIEELRQQLARQEAALEARDAGAVQDLVERLDSLSERIERLTAALATQEAELRARIASLEQQMAAPEGDASRPALPETELQAAVVAVIEERLAGLHSWAAAQNETLQRLEDRLQSLVQAHAALEAAVSTQVQQARDDLEQRLALLRADGGAPSGAATTALPTPALQTSEPAAAPADTEIDARLAQRLADPLDSRWQAEVEGLRRRLRTLALGCATGGALLLAAILVLAL